VVVVVAVVFATTFVFFPTWFPCFPANVVVLEVPTDALPVVCPPALAPVLPERPDGVVDIVVALLLVCTPVLLPVLPERPDGVVETMVALLLVCTPVLLPVLLERPDGVVEIVVAFAPGSIEVYTTIPPFLPPPALLPDVVVMVVPVPPLPTLQAFFCCS